MEGKEGKSKSSKKIVLKITMSMTRIKSILSKLGIWSALLVSQVTCLSFLHVNH